MTRDQHIAVHLAWRGRVRQWLDGANGNQARIARELGVDRRRVSHWFGNHCTDIPSWAIAPISRMTGIDHHTDHLTTLLPF
jgi:predicted XRE-type DNA-binding protein